MSSVRVRFPPSPTGYCHVGTARMAILNYFFAKKNGGTIIFRSEDTDKARSKLEYEEDIKEQLKWLGLSWDEFYRTTELVETHTSALQKLVTEGKAYISKEESKKEPGVLIELVRLRNPGKSVTFTDLIRGDITFDTTELGDFAVARAIDDPLYHLAVVVDDAQQGVTHVIRGEDHISNTPRQILIQEALDYDRPHYAHYPLHLGADKSKLSKRSGDVAVRSYREKGFLPEALLNYIALLGWTPPSQKEILSLEEMIAAFAIEDLHKSGAVFDVEKLRWFNRQYLLKQPEEEFMKALFAIMKINFEERGVLWDDKKALHLMPLLRERISVYEDARLLIREGELDFFFMHPALEVAKIPERKSSSTEAKEHLAYISRIFAALPDADFKEASLKAALWDYATEKGRGAVLWPLRYTLSGRDKSPDPFAIAEILGRKTTLERVRGAQALL